jgi:tRNA (guanine37-N1)-methyltransferase
MESKCLKVPSNIAEKVRRDLLRISAIDLDHKVSTDKVHVYLPLKEDVDISDLQGYGEVVYKVLEPVKKKPRTYKDVVELPEDLKSILPSSYDIIGDIAIMKIPDELLPYTGDIGRALVNTKRNLRTVCQDKGVKGEFRIRDLKVIYGDEDLETIHVENNLRFKLDPSKVYFSPRLAFERDRIARSITGGRVLDMFSGIGPFSLTISRYGEPQEVIGIDLNTECIEYFKSNIMLNSAQDNVEAFLGDAREAPLGMGLFDTVIMNLPHGAMDFLDTALYLIEEGKIHMYSIAGQQDMKGIISEIMSYSEKQQRAIEITGMREVHNYSPDSSMMAIDLHISPISC